MLDAAWEWVGRFGPEDYVWLTKIQGSLWTAADIVICFYLIRLANLGRALLGLRRHVGMYALLAATLPVAAFIPFAPGHAFFRIELAVTLPHFFIIVYILARNLRHGPAMLLKLAAAEH